MGKAQATFEVVELPEVTSPKLTGNMFCACPDFPRVFFLTILVVQNVVQVQWLPEVIEGHVTPN
jgi:hypothetical protein